MKRPFLLATTAILPLALFSMLGLSSVHAQSGLAPSPDQIRATGLVYGVLSDSRFPYAPRELNDAMSSDIYRRYLDLLDSQKLFFSSEDLNKFQAFSVYWDDMIRQRKLQPAFELYDLYKQRVAQRVSFADELLKSGFSFEKEESWQYDREDANWAANTQELNELWRQYVKNDWLRLKLAGRSDEQIRKTLTKRYNLLRTRVQQLDADDAFETFMNAYATSIDPHTNYMSPRSAENFNMQMRLSLEGIGAVLQSQDEYVVIRTLVPGAPAALSEQLSVGDRVIAVGQGDKEPMIDVIGWRIDDVVDMIRGAKGTKVRLEVIPVAMGVDGKSKTVPLIREKVKLEQQAAKRNVIEQGDRKIGVIRLPTFYLDFEARRRGDQDTRSATADVAKHLQELKKENVSGIVLDLRGNGGGSLLEAIELTGLFIDVGPVVQVRDTSGRVSVEADSEPGVAWDGPLAVLVDRSSASASEIFAAAIQDYGRGLIIGEPTFGKGTVQNLLNLDQLHRNSGPVLGEVKLTIAQFFRVNGGTTQHSGVIPDIRFPVTLDADQYGESVYDNAIPASQIAQAEHKSYGNFAPLIDILRRKHEGRVKEDHEWRWWAEDVAEYRSQREAGMISLQESSRLEQRKANEEKRLLREQMRKELGLAESTSSADDGLQAGERSIAEQVAQEEAAESRIDPLLRESVAILTDTIVVLESNSKLTAQVLTKAGTAKVWAH